MQACMSARNFGNGPSTPIKLERVRKLLPWIIKMSTRHVQRFGGEFRLFEPNAGPALYPSVHGPLLEGSPLIALETLRRLDVPYRAVLIDRDPDVVAQLEDALNERGFTDRRRITVLCADNREALPRVCLSPNPRRDRGLIFFDGKISPNTDEDGKGSAFALMETVMAMRSMESIDVLVNIPTNTLKLERAAAQSVTFGSKGYAWDTKDTRPLCERLSLLHKRRLLIGEPTRDRMAWSLILGSSWTGFPEWKAGQFDAADGPIGKERLRRISLSARERKGEA